MAKKLTLADYKSFSQTNNIINNAPVVNSEKQRFEEFNDTHSLQSIDVVFICAQSDEYSAFIEYLQYNNIPMEYYEEIDGHFFQLSIGLNKTKCIVVQQRMSGMVSCACLACCLFRYRPKLFVMPGICGGIKGRVAQGDIVVVATTYDYGAGKYLQDGTFEPAPNQLQINNVLFREVGAICQNMERIFDSCPTNILTIKDGNGNTSEKSANNVKIHKGTMATGAAVINNMQIAEAMKEDNRRVIAFDMEAYALAYASTNYADNPIPWLVVKGVQDYPDTSDKDIYTKFAATISSAFAIEVVKHHNFSN